MSALGRPFRGAVLLACLVGPGAAAAASEPLTLDAAIGIALEHNRTLRSSAHATAGAAAAARATVGTFLPRIDLAGKYTRINEPIVIDLGDLRTAMIGADIATLQASGTTDPRVLAGLRSTLDASLPPFSDQLQKQEYYNLSATLVQPLFAGGALAANARARAIEHAIAQTQERAVRNTVITSVVTGYFRIKLMDSVVAIRKEVLDGIAEHDAQAQNMLVQGLISRAARLRARVALSEADRAYRKAQRDRELAGLLFDTTLERPTSSYTLTTGFPATKDIRSADSYLGEAARGNADLALIASKQALLRQKIAGVRSRFLPSVAAFGKYELYMADLSLLEPAWAAGVSASINIFSGGTDALTMRAAAQESAAVRELDAQAREMVALSVKRSLHDLDTAREQYESLNTSAELAEENLKLAKLSFAEGLATSTDVIDAELSLGSVKTEQLTTLYDYTTALVTLLATCGDAGAVIPSGRTL
jgi:outer membrane protein TolC